MRTVQEIVEEVSNLSPNRTYGKDYIEELVRELLLSSADHERSCTETLSHDLDIAECAVAVRRFDELGRILIPKCTRDALGLEGLRCLCSKPADIYPVKQISTGRVGAVILLQREVVDIIDTTDVAKLVESTKDCKGGNFLVC